MREDTAARYRAGGKVLGPRPRTIQALLGGRPPRLTYLHFLDFPQFKVEHSQLTSALRSRPNSAKFLSEGAGPGRGGRGP